MRTRLFGRLALMAIVVPAGIAWTADRAGLALQPESKLWVEGTSSVRSYTCRAARVLALTTVTFWRGLVLRNASTFDSKASRSAACCAAVSSCSFNPP